MKVMKWILKIIVAAIIILIASSLIIFVLFFTVNSKEQADKEVQHLNSNSEKTALILYQDSRLGLTKKVIDLADRTLQSEGYSVTLNHPRTDSPYDVKDFDIVILASPVYAGQVSKPLLNYAEKQDFSGVNVFVLLTGSDCVQTAEMEAVKEKVVGAAILNSIKVDKADKRVSDALKEMTGL